MVDIYKYLCNEDNKKSLAKYLHENVPELIECDINRGLRDRINILEYNKEGFPSNCSWFDGTGVSRGYPPHHFILVIEDSTNKSFSYQCLWSIYDNTNFDDIEKVSKEACWGFKIGEDNPWKYPKLGLKVKKIIINHIRKNKINNLYK